MEALYLNAVPSYSEKVVAHLLLFLLMTYSTAGIRSPLIMLQQYEGSGIRLICKSKVEESPEILLLSWMDSKGQELASVPIILGNASLDFLLEPGYDNAISCRIIGKSSGHVLESTSLVIEDTFFPAISGYMVAFFLIAVLGILLIIGTVFKLKRDKLKIAQAVNEKNALQDEILSLQNSRESEKKLFEKDLKEAQDKFAKDTAELDFRRASSNAVNLTLDPKCTHAKLNIKDKNKVRLNPSDSGLKDLKGTPIAVANEGFDEDKKYWEVEVGQKPDWELGVLSEKARKKLEQEKLEKQLEDDYVSMRWFQGQYHCSGGNSLISSENKECKVVGVYLIMDGEEQMLSFFDVEQMNLIRSIPAKFSEKMFPFFNPGKDEGYLGVRPVNIPPCLESL
ncbi:erythroid membrane-associated protein-like isoform X1 [Python bivittatus]|uniref:Erythroid membrane-associated protein-like isoform X1 n=1 Tax=Python bivittatus TaxID=176946 RepID=A0A9F3QTI3_PYTBI|nr:erythroid membrane-associated protein-like isoform X1 [Python bivittatus]